MKSNARLCLDRSMTDLADTCSMALIYLRRAGWAVRKDEREN